MQALKLRAVLVLIAGYFVLGYSFMLLRVPPSDIGVPLGEIVLALCLCTTNLPLCLRRMSQAVFAQPLFLWWGIALVHLVLGLQNYGFWAIRDASHFLNSLFIIVGFAVASQRVAWDRFNSWIPWIMGATIIYASTFLIQEEVKAISPTLSGASGQEVPLLGIFAGTSTILLLAVTYLLVYRPPPAGKLSVWIAAACVAFVVVIFQARTTYLQLVALFAMFFVFRRDVLRRSLAIVPVFILAVGILMQFEVKIPGRLSSEISFEFFADHVAAIFGAAGSEELAGAAEGVQQRLGWWQDVFDRLLVDPVRTFTGLGYGVPLVTNFINAESVAVREPHNSIMSMLGRLGAVGLVLYAAVNIVLFRALLSSIRAARQQGWTRWQDTLLLMFGYFIVVFVMALTEDAFEKPYLTIPYYTFWGFVLRFRYELNCIGYETSARGVPPPDALPAQAAQADAGVMARP
jgi:O-antigen ligase